MRDFAARLIAHEAGPRSADSGASAAFAVSEKMRAHLTTLMGNGGHRALLMRALALAGAEVSWLRDIEVAVDGTLQGTAPSDESVAPDEVHEGGVVLVAQLLGLLVAFIGERLTLQLVREVWPKIPARDLNFKL
jgi:hypothetical protein